MGWQDFPQIEEEDVQQQLHPGTMKFQAHTVSNCQRKASEYTFFFGLKVSFSLLVHKVLLNATKENDEVKTLALQKPWFWKVNLLENVVRQHNA